MAISTQVQASGGSPRRRSNTWKIEMWRFRETGWTVRGDGDEHMLERCN